MMILPHRTLDELAVPFTCIMVEDGVVRVTVRKWTAAVYCSFGKPLTIQEVLASRTAF